MFSVIRVLSLFVLLYHPRCATLRTKHCLSLESLSRKCFVLLSQSICVTARTMHCLSFGSFSGKCFVLRSQSKCVTARTIHCLSVGSLTGKCFVLSQSKCVTLRIGISVVSPMTAMTILTGPGRLGARPAPPLDLPMTTQLAHTQVSLFYMLYLVIVCLLNHIFVCSLFL